ncbi:MAG: LacI family DNA-binding transcriptional regulator [Bacteroidales bacterium]
MSQPKKSRIKDIAARAGVSIGTVDRVLHNRSEVSAETAEKVRAIMREMNYEPDILARTLVSNRQLRFAALLPGTFHQVSFWEKPLEGMRRAIREIGHFGISFEPYYFDMFERQTFLDQGNAILKMKPDGLILAPVFSRDSFHLISRCKDMQIPVVLINSEIRVKYPLSFIGQDSWQSGRVGAQMLQGFTNEGSVIGIIHVAKDLAEQKHIAERERGFRDYFESARSSRRILAPALSIPVFNEEEADPLIRKYVKQHKGLKAIFVTNSNVYKVAHCFAKFGIKDVLLAGYDLTEENKTCLLQDQIAFLIEQKPEEQGYRGIMTLFNTLVMKKEPEYRQFLPIEIVLKENLKYYKN